MRRGECHYGREEKRTWNLGMSIWRGSRVLRNRWDEKQGRRRPFRYPEHKPKNIRRDASCWERYTKILLRFASHLGRRNMPFEAIVLDKFDVCNKLWDRESQKNMWVVRRDSEIKKKERKVFDFLFWSISRRAAEDQEHGSFLNRFWRLKESRTLSMARVHFWEPTGKERLPIYSGLYLS